MGLYWSCLSKPILDKYSTDEANNKLNCGTSSMQGWRDDQEDAHNCILDYDEDTSYFAVYDGHGGVEVAKYCSDCLPGFLKEVEAYKNEKIEKALEDAFLQFDATITSKEIGIKLKKYGELARKSTAKRKICVHEDLEDGDDDEEEEENITNLYEEAAMPLEKVIEKYKAQKILNNATTTDKHSDSLLNNSSTSTTQIAETSGEVSSSNNISSKNDNSNDESTVSSGSQSKESHEIKSGETIIESKVDLPDSSGDAREECTSSDDTNANKIENQNGVKAESTQNCESRKSDVTSSSTAIITCQENGELIKKGKGEALTKTKGVVPKREPRPKRTAQQYYNSILSIDECSEEESDEKDETFEGQNDDSSDDEEEEEEEEINNLVGAEDNSDESSVDDLLENDDEEDYADTEYGNPGAQTGCTAVVALLKGYDLYVANAGDSRCVVCRNGQAIEMSLDHKPENEPEYSRIIKAGDFVSDGRVNGGLNLSRAIGDFCYKDKKYLSDKEQAITALPDVKTLKIKPGEDEFMILACDGVWDSMSSQEVVDYVRVRIQEGREKLSQICEELFDHCLAPDLMGDGVGCDNMTAIIVEFKPVPLKRRSTEPYESEHCKQIKIKELQESTKT